MTFWRKVTWVKMALVKRSHHLLWSKKFKLHRNNPLSISYLIYTRTFDKITIGQNLPCCRLKIFHDIYPSCSILCLNIRSNSPQVLVQEIKWLIPSVLYYTRILDILKFSHNIQTQIHTHFSRKIMIYSFYLV